MKVLIIGAGTIGMTCGFLLSGHNQVALLAKDGNLPKGCGEVTINITEVKKNTPGRRITYAYAPNWVVGTEGGWDVVLVAVNRIQLSEVLPRLAALAGKPPILFLMNHWCIREEVERYLEPSDYIIGFPSFIGGGREVSTGREAGSGGTQNEVLLDVNLYEEALPLGLPGRRERSLSQQDTERIAPIAEIFQGAGVRWEYRPDMESWLKVHFLQQSVSAGAILKAGGYDALAKDREALAEMVRAMKEGLLVCRRSGAAVNDPAIRMIERLPVWMSACGLSRLFLDPATARMVKGHMKKGMPEWIAGFREVLEAGRAAGISMPHWQGYESCL